MIEGRMDLDLRDLDDGLREMARAGKNLTPVWRELAPVMKQDQREHFRLRRGIDGRWPARKPRRKRGRKVLGKLRTAFGVTFNRLALIAKSKVAWASAHQDGEEVGRGVTMPQREHIYMSEMFIERALEKLRERLRRAW